ncbi:MAG: TetR/AcrR family transcriptional regulator [Acidimicrobiales bacterium]
MGDEHPTAGATKGEQTRQAVLDAAIARFGADGYRATSVARIARDADVSGTVPYAYFPNKGALFLAALDEDAAGVIHEAVSSILDDPESRAWQSTVIVTLVTALDAHPLARRVLAGLEPHVTDRMLDIPALAELRKAVAERIAHDQLAGVVRTDVDPAAMANGTVVIILSLLMSVVQFGPGGIAAHGPDVFAVFEAAFRPT